MLQETFAACPELTGETAAITEALETDPSALSQTLTFLAKGKTGPTPPPSVKLSEGAQVGPYRLIKALGEGGMGSVFLAEQTEPVTRQVALKLLHGIMN